FVLRAAARARRRPLGATRSVARNMTVRPMLALPTAARRAALLASIGAAVALWGGGVASAAAVAPVRHVVVIVLENKEFVETFGPGRVDAPYLTETLPAQGALVANYFGTGHSSADNYIAMIAGQPPTTESKEDCPDPLTTLPETSDANGVAQGGGGCVYPANFKTIGDQLAAKRLTWKAYAENVPTLCSLVHDAPGDYARKHDPSPLFC